MISVNIMPTNLNLNGQDAAKQQQQRAQLRRQQLRHILGLDRIRFSLCNFTGVGFNRLRSA